MDLFLVGRLLVGRVCSDLIIDREQHAACRHG
jgi:hypothetical protein